MVHSPSARPPASLDAAAALDQEVKTLPSKQAIEEVCLPPARLLMPTFCRPLIQRGMKTCSGSVPPEQESPTHSLQDEDVLLHQGFGPSGDRTTSLDLADDYSMFSFTGGTGNGSALSVGERARPVERQIPSPAGPMKYRVWSASLILIHSLPLNDILEAAFWRSEDILLIFCLRDSRRLREDSFFGVSSVVVVDQSQVTATVSV